MNLSLYNAISIDKESMVIKLTRENINYLFYGKPLLFSVDLNFTAYENDKYINSAILVEATDDINLVLVPSPIIIILSGHNRVYGKLDIVSISASNSYDPDGEVLSYSQLIEYKWR